jgi:hypothetical protein
MLNMVLRYVFNHLVAVIALRREPSYNATAGSGMTM